MSVSTLLGSICCLGVMFPSLLMGAGAHKYPGLLQSRLSQETFPTKDKKLDDRVFFICQVGNNVHPPNFQTVPNMRRRTMTNTYLNLRTKKVIFIIFWSCMKCQFYKHTELIIIVILIIHCLFMLYFDMLEEIFLMIVLV